jgi:RHS repeat-associated protein
VNGALVKGFLWQDVLRIAAELDSANAVVSRFVYASGVNVPEYMVKGGVTYRIITDQVGSVRMVVNVADGTIAQRLDYDSFGNVTQDTAPGFQPFGFAGGLYDPDTKLVRFGARDYDAQVGRWTTKEPVPFLGGDTNLYAYTENDPVNNLDFNGFEDITAQQAVAIAQDLSDYGSTAGNAVKEITKGNYGASFGHAVSGGLKFAGNLVKSLIGDFLRDVSEPYLDAHTRRLIQSSESIDNSVLGSVMRIGVGDFLRLTAVGTGVVKQCINDIQKFQNRGSYAVASQKFVYFVRDLHW